MRSTGAWDREVKRSCRYNKNGTKRQNDKNDRSDWRRKQKRYKRQQRKSTRTLTSSRSSSGVKSRDGSTSKQ